jgi:hypothetical protein
MSKITKRTVLWAISGPILLIAYFLLFDRFFVEGATNWFLILPGWILFGPAIAIPGIIDILVPPEFHAQLWYQTATIGFILLVTAIQFGLMEIIFRSPKNKLSGVALTSPQK